MDVRPVEGDQQGFSQSGVTDHALVSLLYEELKRLARAKLSSERAGHTLTATALVSEMFLRLHPHREPWPSREYLLLAAAEAMRRILIDHARMRAAAKRGGEWSNVSEQADLAEFPYVQVNHDVDVLDLDEHLDAMAKADPDAHRVVMLRYFAGLTGEDTASLLGVDRKTVTRRWTAARAWLYERMMGREVPRCASQKIDQDSTPA